MIGQFVINRLPEKDEGYEVGFMVGAGEDTYERWNKCYRGYDDFFDFIDRVFKDFRRAGK